MALPSTQRPAPAAASAVSSASGAPVPIDTLRTLLRGLNREQRQAVTHRSGPLVVVAGPGTGKTEVVTRRVAWLIAAKLARPREILALTFTDNAASEMQARVDMLVPYGQADAAIHTFHAFGDRLLREHAFELGLGGDVRLVTRSDAILLLREHLFELGLQRYLPLGDPTRFLGALADLFGRAKDEDVMPEVLAAHAQRLVLEAGPANGLDSALADRAAGHAELAAAYRRYCELLTRGGLIDHADQVALPLRLLRERPAVRQQVLERYRFLLVDELQDTNRSQLELALALTGPAGNVMVVGDPDQGIYGFRGALSGNLARFEAALPGVRRVVLRRNYRSLAPILAASGRLVGPAAVADEPARQVPHRRARRPQPVRCRAYASPEAEADAIAEQIAQRVDGGARPSDFAVLVRSNGETDSILRSLLARGVPAHNGARPTLLDLPAVRALLAFLRVVADPHDSLELYVLASSWPYQLGAAEMNPLLQTSRRRHVPLWDIFRRLEEWATPTPTTQRRIGALVDHVSAGLAMAAERASGEVLYDYLRRSGLLARLARADGEGPDILGLHGVARLFNIVRARASLLAHDRVALLVPHLAELAEGDVDTSAEEWDADRVAVLTVHRAKGLEFKVVYLAGLVDGRFPVRSRPPLLGLPAELAAADPAGDDGLAEERRLFYVAMTRARDELWLSHHVGGPGGRSRRRPSPFIAEALDQWPTAGAPVTTPAVGAGQQIELLARPTAVAQNGSRSAGGPLSLSYSQVDDYLTCPERYRLRHVVGLPVPAHHALAYGSALHQAVAAFHLRQGQGEANSVEQLLAEFANAWRPEGFLSRQHEEARYQAGQAALRRFHRRELAAGTKPVAIERPFRFRLGHDQVVGRIDRLDRTDAGTVITDYKSSDVRDSKRADQKARDSLQLQVYALAHEAETGELPAAVQLHFLDGDVVGRAEPDPERLTRARATLASVADGIRGEQFGARPSAYACGYCPFRQICPSSAA